MRRQVLLGCSLVFALAAYQESAAATGPAPAAPQQKPTAPRRNSNVPLPSPVPSETDSTWEMELPAIGSVRAVTADPVIQEATFAVLRDYIEKRTGKGSPLKGSQMPPALQKRWFEYLEVVAVDGPARYELSAPARRLYDRSAFRTATLSRYISRESVAAYKATPGFQQAVVEEAGNSTSEGAVRATSIADEQAKGPALAAGRKAKARGVDTIFGIPMGAELRLPPCSSSVSAASNPTMGFVTMGKTWPTVDGPTCVAVDAAGSASIVWRNGTLPNWAQAVVTKVQAGILTSVTIQILPPPPLTGNNLVDSLRGVGRELGEANVKEAHKQLAEKYGTPTTSRPMSYTNGYGATMRTVDEPEWHLQGLHVVYKSTTSLDTITIELESIANARTKVEHDKRAAGPKL